MTDPSTSDRRGLLGILAAVGIGLLAAVLVMATLRAEQQVNADAIRALEQRAESAEVSARQARDDAAAAQRELAELRSLLRALEQQVRDLGAVPVTEAGSRSPAPRPAPSSDDEPAGTPPTAAPSPPPESSPPPPTPQPSPTPPGTSPTPQPLLCLPVIGCLGEP